MLVDESTVTAPADTTDKSDGIEVETNIEPTPENSVEDKGSKPKSEPKEAPQPEKPVNPRTQQRKAEKERLIRENAELKERNRANEEKLNPKQPEQQTRQVDLSKRPDITKYTQAQYLDYVEDLAKYNASELLSERDKKSAEAERNNQIASFQEQTTDIRNAMPDFDDRMQKLYDAGLVSAPIENAVLKSSMSGKLAEHFINFPGDLKQLNDYRPELIPQAIKAIENFIKAPKESKEEKPRITQATPPIKPPGNSAKTDRSINSYTQEEIENMPLSEYRAQFMKN